VRILRLRTPVAAIVVRCELGRRYIHITVLDRAYRMAVTQLLGCHSPFGWVDGLINQGPAGLDGRHTVVLDPCRFLMDRIARERAASPRLCSSAICKGPFVSIGTTAMPGSSGEP